MKRQKLVDTLHDHAGEIHRMGVRSLSVFGSVARDEAGEMSDVDLLVEFQWPVGLFAFAQVRRRLCEIVGCQVDLVTHDALRQEMREEILREAIHAA